jgi:hypothetical protein
MIHKQSKKEQMRSPAAYVYFFKAGRVLLAIHASAQEKKRGHPSSNQQAAST